METKNTIKLIACGGAGINLATAIAENYNTIISNLANLKITAMDTSSAEKQNAEKIGMEFIHVKSSSIDAKELVGSGGRRDENAKHIAEAVNMYLDNNPSILKASPTDFYVITTSLSGGTGSVMAPVLASRLLKLGHNVVVVGVSDTASEMDVTNSLDSLNLLTLAANKANRNLAMMNITNSDYDTLDKANAVATSLLITLGTFLSESIISIDPRDMAVLLNPMMLENKFNIPDGIVEIETYNGDTPPELNKGTGVIVHREIRNDRATVKSDAIAYKRGELSGQLLNDYIEAALLPLSIRTLAGEIMHIKDALEEEKEKFTVTNIREDTCDEDDELGGLL